jgi:hypothetical protein
MTEGGGGGLYLKAILRLYDEEIIISYPKIYVNCVVVINKKIPFQLLIQIIE